MSVCFQYPDSFKYCCRCNGIYTILSVFYLSFMIKYLFNDDWLKVLHYITFLVGLVHYNLLKRQFELVISAMLHINMHRFWCLRLAILLLYEHKFVTRWFCITWLRWACMWWHRQVILLLAASFTRFVAIFIWSYGLATSDSTTLLPSITSQDKTSLYLPRTDWFATQGTHTIISSPPINSTSKILHIHQAIHALLLFPLIYIV